MLRILIVTTLCFFFVGCSSKAAEPEEVGTSVINSYEDCVAAGYPILRSLPPQCVTPDKQFFIKGSTPKPTETQGSDSKAGCVDRCGNGTCEQIVCMALNCPCAETPESCPQDCGSGFNNGY